MKKKRPPARSDGPYTESFGLVELGEPVYKMEMPPARSVVQVVPTKGTPIRSSPELVDLGEPVYKMRRPSAEPPLQTPEAPQPADEQ